MDCDRAPSSPTLHHDPIIHSPSPSPANKGKAREPPLDSCVICLEPVSERAIAVPCDHCAFDFLCLVSWTQAHPTCPLCKTTLTAVQYDWRAPHDYKTYIIPREEEPCPAAARVNRRSAPQRALPPRPRRPPPAPRPFRSQPEEAALRSRKYVYTHQLYSAHVGANRVSQYRDLTPAQFAKSRDLQSRARAWIRRELQVFDFLSPDAPSPHTRESASEHRTPAARTLRRQQNAEFVLEYIVSILKTVDIRAASGQAQEMVGDLLGAENAALFLHELNAWLRSPYARLEDWDRHVQYTRPLPVFGLGRTDG